jgi:hypothetical protein
VMAKEGVNGEGGRQFLGADVVSAANRGPRFGGRMERLWKNEGAMRRKRFDRFKPRNRFNKPDLFATGWHRLPPKSHGKKGVDGSSPSEGFAKGAANRAVAFASSCKSSNVTSLQELLNVGARHLQTDKHSITSSSRGGATRSVFGRSDTSRSPAEVI